MKEAKGFVKIVSAAEDEYMPGYPPMSPVTNSYFTMWAMFDVQFGCSRETIGTCVLRATREFDCPNWLFDAFSIMQQSRMKFFVHCGHKDGSVKLREVGSEKIVTCLVPTGYVGEQGQIWFARLLPPPNALCSQHIVFTTPYVIRSFAEQDFVDCIERETKRMEAKKKFKKGENHQDHFMKYGANPTYWNEYVFCAYSNYQHDAIFLHGIPDIPATLPHAAH